MRRTEVLVFCFRLTERLGTLMIRTTLMLTVKIHSYKHGESKGD